MHSLDPLFGLLHWSKYLLLGLFVLCAIYVSMRGKVHHTIGRQLTDHSTFMAPYNTLMYLFSAVPNTPFIDLKHFPQLEPLRQNWQTIRDEGLHLFDEGYIRAAAGYNDLGFNSFFRTGWKRFYLKWYEDFLPSATRLCPRTAALLASIPSVNAAMFALLPPGARLNRHRDPFAGSLRYHLGLSTPNSEDCRIFVDGNLYYWRDGEGVIFDETFIHRAENNTSQPRLILFCDVERPLSNRFARTLNHSLGRRLCKAAATQNVEGERIGVLNRIFGWVYHSRLLGKRFKAWNRNAYYLVKWILIGSLAYLIFLY
jgi:beta-hydroxylase